MDKEIVPQRLGVGSMSQLAAKGPQDEHMYRSIDDEKTSVFQFKHQPYVFFASNTIELDFKEDIYNFGSTVSLELKYGDKFIADMIGEMYLMLDLPALVQVPSKVQGTANTQAMMRKNFNVKEAYNSEMLQKPIVKPTIPTVFSKIKTLQKKTKSVFKEDIEKDVLPVITPTPVPRKKKVTPTLKYIPVIKRKEIPISKNIMTPVPPTPPPQQILTMKYKNKTISTPLPINMSTPTPVPTSTPIFTPIYNPDILTLKYSPKRDDSYVIGSDTRETIKQTDTSDTLLTSLPIEPTPINSIVSTPIAITETIIQTPSPNILNTPVPKVISTPSPIIHTPMPLIQTPVPKLIHTPVPKLIPTPIMGKNLIKVTPGPKIMTTPVPKVIATPVLTDITPIPIKQTPTPKYIFTPIPEHISTPIVFVELHTPIPQTQPTPIPKILATPVAKEETTLKYTLLQDVVPVNTPSPIMITTPTPTPNIIMTPTPTPTPIMMTPTPSLVIYTPTPTPMVMIPTPSPIIYTPTPIPEVYTPTPIPKPKSVTMKYKGMTMKYKPNTKFNMKANNDLKNTFLKISGRENVPTPIPMRKTNGFEPTPSPTIEASSKVMNSTLPTYVYNDTFYTNKIGFALIDNVSFLIDGEVITEYSGEYLELHHRLYTSKAHENGLKEMVGVYDTEDEIRKNALCAKKLFVPLPLFWSKTYKQYFPLIAMSESKIEVKISFKKLRDVAYVYDTLDTVFMRVGNNGTISLQVGESDTIASHEPLQAKLLLEHHILSPIEKTFFQRNINEFIFRSPQINILPIRDKLNKLQLSFLQPTEWLAFCYRERGNGRYQFSKIESLRMYFNGIERIREPPNSEFYRLLQKHLYFDNNSNDNVYVYSFALKAGHGQPSGSINMSKIIKKELEISVPTKASYDDELIVLSSSYNILKTDGSKGNLMFY